MATTTFYHIQDCSNGQYKTSTGWTSNLADAQLLSPSDTSSSTYYKTVLESLTAGDYIVIRIDRVS